MDKQTALQTLGLDETAGSQEIQTALANKKKDIAEKKRSAPTEALKAKFEAIEAKLADAEAALGEAVEPDKEAAEKQASASPSSLSQTKLADLPGLAPQDAAQVELQPGQVIAGRYEIKELIGQGGMGAVYRAFDKNRDEEIAIKVLLPSLTKNERALERFLNEARISSKLSHPSIVNVYDVQNEDDLYFLIMELLEGQDLRQVMDNQKAVERPFEIDDVKEYINGISEGLAYAHQHTVHRDIKPENIWITEDQQIKLMDFGIAQLQSTSRRTQTGAAMGTAYYMAPEQLKGVKDIDGRADQYALAVLAYELLTGEVPAGAIEPIQSLRKDIPKGMAAAIMQALSPRPENRFADIQAFNQAIQSGKGAKTRKVKAATPASAANLHGGGPNKLAIVVVMLLILGGVGGAVGTGVLDLSALLPMSKEEQRALQADAVRLQGQINTLARRLENARRNLDADLRDAERNDSDDLPRLQRWQDAVERNLFSGSLMSDLEGERAVAEALLRDKEYQPATASFEKARDGYETALAEFQAGADLFQVESEADAVRQRYLSLQGEAGYGTPDIAQKGLGEYEAAESAEGIGELLQSIEQWRQAESTLREAVTLVEETREAARNALAVRSRWNGIKNSYGVKADEPERSAVREMKAAQQDEASGELSSASASWSLAKKHWNKALNSVSKRVAAIDAEKARLERIRQVEAAARERERQKKLSEAERLQSDIVRMVSDQSNVRDGFVNVTYQQENKVISFEGDASASADRLCVISFSSRFSDIGSGSSYSRRSCYSKRTVIDFKRPVDDDLLINSVIGDEKIEHTRCIESNASDVEMSYVYEEKKKRDGIAIAFNDSRVLDRFSDKISKFNKLCAELSRSGKIN